MAKRKFEVWDRSHGRGDSIVIDADSASDAARELCSRRDECEVNEREVCVREMDRSELELVEDEDLDADCIATFDVRAESDRYWLAEKHWEPPPETEAQKSARLEFEQRMKEELERLRHQEGQRVAARSLAWVGWVVEQATKLELDLCGLGFAPEQIPTIFSALELIQRSRRSPVRSE